MTSECWRFGGGKFWGIFWGDHRTFCESQSFWSLPLRCRGALDFLYFFGGDSLSLCRDLPGTLHCREDSGIVPGKDFPGMTDRFGGGRSVFGASAPGRRSLRHSFLLRHCLSRRDYPCKALLDNPVMGLPHCINPVRGISAPRTTNVVRRACRRSHNIVNHLFSAEVYSEYTFVFLGIKFLLGQAESRAIVLFGIELAILEFPQ